MDDLETHEAERKGHGRSGLNLRRDEIARDLCRPAGYEERSSS